MTSLLFEQPWIIGAIGAILAIVTFYGWIQTGNSIAFKSGWILLIVTILLIALNVSIVTSGEEVRTWLKETAAELQANQYEKVLARIHPEASAHVQSNRAQVKLIRFESVKITQIHRVEVVTKYGLPRATAQMNVVVDGTFREIAGKTARWISLTLEKVNGKWLVLEMEEREPQHEFMNSDGDFPLKLPSGN
jgi:Cu/Ag efflux protein CusF